MSNEICPICKGSGQVRPSKTGGLPSLASSKWRCDPCDGTGRVKPKTQLLDGKPVPLLGEHADIDPATGMQKNYVVLSPEERAKGFVRPVRSTYIHCGVDAVFNGVVLIKPGVTKNGSVACGTRTIIGLALAETIARDPYFYSGTFCCGCRKHFPIGRDGEFVWEGTTEKVGT